MLAISTHQYPSAITGNIRARLIAAANLTHYADGAVIHQRGDRKPSLSIILAGAVRVGNRGRDGRYQLTAILGPGASFGGHTLFADLPRTQDADAAGPTEIANLSRSIFRRAARDDRELESAVLAEISLRFNDALELLDDALRLSLDVRIAKTLLRLSAPYASNGADGGADGQPDSAMRISITQSDLADMHGVSRLSVSACLKSLQGGGLVNRGYNEITIPDPAAIRRFVEAQAELAPLG